jgi:hypothetical protein
MQSEDKIVRYLLHGLIYYIVKKNKRKPKAMAYLKESFLRKILANKAIVVFTSEGTGKEEKDYNSEA